MSEIVHRVEANPWIPRVVREGDQLILRMGVDFNRGYDIREFDFPITDEHLTVLRSSLARHLILWCVLERLAEQAGSTDRNGKPNKKKAARAIEVVLLGGEQEVEQYVVDQDITPYSLQRMISHGGDPALIAQGRLFQALEGRVQVEPDWKRVREHRADQDRAERGIHLGPLDKALLKFTNRYEGWSGIGSRRPEQVPPAMLDTVLAFVASAQEATASVAPTAPLDEWESAVGVALRSTRPALLDEPIRAVASLLRGEAPDRDWSERKMPRLEDVAGDLRLHLYDAAELALIAEVTPEAGGRPHVEPVGGELFVGVERRLSFAKYEAVTEDDLLLWNEQQQATFAQLIRAGVARAQLGKHVARDRTCWVFFDHLAAAVLVDPDVRATIIDPARLPVVPACSTLVPDGDLVVAALSRLAFVMTGSRDEAGMREILKAADEALHRGTGLISPRPLVWRHGRWLAFDWAAEFPQLAERTHAVTEAYADAWLEAMTK